MKNKTPEEIENLKRNWLCDPCWDIEHTEGFESYKEELKTFRLSHEEKVRKRVEKEDLEKMIKHGISNKQLLNYLQLLEWKIEALEKEIDKLKGY